MPTGFLDFVWSSGSSGSSGSFSASVVRARALSERAPPPSIVLFLFDVFSGRDV